MFKETKMERLKKKSGACVLKNEKYNCEIKI